MDVSEVTVGSSRKRKGRAPKHKTAPGVKRRRPKGGTSDADQIPKLSGNEWGHLKPCKTDELGQWTRVVIDDQYAYGVSEQGFLALEELDGEAEEYTDAFTGGKIVLGPGSQKGAKKQSRKVANDAGLRPAKIQPKVLGPGSAKPLSRAQKAKAKMELAETQANRKRADLADAEPKPVDRAAVAATGNAIARELAVRLGITVN